MNSVNKLCNEEKSNNFANCKKNTMDFDLDYKTKQNVLFFAYSVTILMKSR